MSKNSYASDADGNAKCGMPNAEGTSSCGCNEEAAREPVLLASAELPRDARRVSQIRSAAAFVIASVASPCCTPLYVPLLLILFAGTPIAAWIGQNIGWLYGALTLISAASLVMALYWRQKNATITQVHPRVAPNARAESTKNQVPEMELPHA